MKEKITVLFAMLMRSLASILQFLINLLIGRAYGGEGLGGYSIFISYGTLLGYFNNFGYSNKAIKDVASSEENKCSRSFRLYILNLLKKLIILCILSILIIYLGLTFFRTKMLTLVLGNDKILLLLLFSLFVTLNKIFSDILKGAQKLLFSVWFEFNFFPILVLILCGSHYLFNSQSIDFIFPCLLISIIITFSFNLLFVLRHLRNIKVVESTTLKEQMNYWGIMLFNALLTQSPFLVLPFYADVQQIGFFAAAYKLVAISSTFQSILGSYFSPIFAKMRLKNDFFSLKIFYYKSRKYSLLISLAIFVFFLIFGKTILSFYGKDFIKSFWVLFILSAGRIINGFTGLTEFFLNMSGYSRVEFFSSVLAVIIFFILSFALGHNYQYKGIVVAFVLSYALRGIISYLYIKVVIW